MTRFFLPAVLIIAIGTAGCGDPLDKNVTVRQLQGYVDPKVAELRAGAVEHTKTLDAHSKALTDNNQQVASLQEQAKAAWTWDPAEKKIRLIAPAVITDSQKEALTTAAQEAARLKVESMEKERERPSKLPKVPEKKPETMPEASPEEEPKLPEKRAPVGGINPLTAAPPGWTLEKIDRRVARLREDFRDAGKQYSHYQIVVEDFATSTWWLNRKNGIGRQIRQLLALREELVESMAPDEIERLKSENERLKNQPRPALLIMPSHEASQSAAIVQEQRRREVEFGRGYPPTR